MVILIEINKFDKDALYHLYCLIFYIDKVVKDWLQVIKHNIFAKDLILNTFLFTDDRVIGAGTDELQRIAYTKEYSYCIKHNLKILVNKAKEVAMKGNTNVISKIVINNNT
jgi:hypothetical protein